MAKKVYLLFSTGCDNPWCMGYEIISAFSSKEKAEKERDALNKELPECLKDRYVVIETEVID